MNTYISKILKMTQFNDGKTFGHFPEKRVINKYIKDWRCGSSGRAPVLQV
jgi:hypothetical protein